MIAFRERCRPLFLAIPFVFISILAISGSSLADMCCYIVPVEVSMKGGSSRSGYLILYGDEIRGFDKSEGPVRKTVSFGMNMPSTPEHIGVGLDYAFDSMEISGASVTIRIGSAIHTVYRVSHFFTDKGLPFAPSYRKSREGLLRAELNALPLSELKLVRRTGSVRSLPAYAD